MRGLAHGLGRLARDRSALAGAHRFLVENADPTRIGGLSVGEVARSIFTGDEQAATRPSSKNE